MIFINIITIIIIIVIGVKSLTGSLNPSFRKHVIPGEWEVPKENCECPGFKLWLIQSPDVCIESFCSLKSRTGMTLAYRQSRKKVCFSIM